MKKKVLALFLSAAALCDGVSGNRYGCRVWQR